MKLAVPKVNALEVRYSKDIPQDNLTVTAKDIVGVYRCVKCGERVPNNQVFNCPYCDRIIINSYGMSYFLRQRNKVNNVS